jgi:hypothetical protein
VEDDPIFLLCDNKSILYLFFAKKIIHSDDFEKLIFFHQISHTNKFRLCRRRRFASPPVKSDAQREGLEEEDETSEDSVVSLTKPKQITRNSKPPMNLFMASVCVCLFACT